MLVMLIKVWEGLAYACYWPQKGEHLLCRLKKVEKQNANLGAHSQIQTE